MHGSLFSEWPLPNRPLCRLWKTGKPHHYTIAHFIETARAGTYYFEHCSFASRNSTLRNTFVRKNLTIDIFVANIDYYNYNLTRVILYQLLPKTMWSWEQMVLSPTSSNTDFVVGTIRKNVSARRSNKSCENIKRSAHLSICDRFSLDFQHWEKFKKLQCFIFQTSELHNIDNFWLSQRIKEQLKLKSSTELTHALLCFGNCHCLHACSYPIQLVWKESTFLWRCVIATCGTFSVQNNKTCISRIERCMTAQIWNVNAINHS